jgi:hypothetical protein
MRPDMAKIIVERPRPPSRVPRGRDGRRFRDASDSPFLPMKAGYRDPKSFNENLRPLARYLARQVGRPWDAVYRDVRAVIDGRSTVQQHILQHLTQFVATHTRVVDGDIIDVGAQILGVGRVWQPLYVHPRTGLLLRNPDAIAWRIRDRERALAAERARDAKWRELSPTTQLHRLDGEWFEVTIATLPAAPATRWDAVRRCHTARSARTARYSSEDWDTEERYGRPGVYAVSKRQLSAREIRDYELQR